MKPPKIAWPEGVVSGAPVHPATAAFVANPFREILDEMGAFVYATDLNGSYV